MKIIQTMGNELNKIGLTCAMAVRNDERKSFTIQYTSMPAETLERLEIILVLPSLDPRFSLRN